MPHSFVQFLFARFITQLSPTSKWSVCYKIILRRPRVRLSGLNDHNPRALSLAKVGFERHYDWQIKTQHVQYCRKYRLRQCDEQVSCKLTLNLGASVCITAVAPNSNITQLITPLGLKFSLNQWPTLSKSVCTKWLTTNCALCQLIIVLTSKSTQTDRSTILQTDKSTREKSFPDNRVTKFASALKHIAHTVCWRDKPKVDKPVAQICNGNAKLWSFQHTESQFVITDWRKMVIMFVWCVPAQAN